MTSIRAKLLFWLVPCFVIIAILAISALYLSEQRRLNASLTNELNEFARIIKLTLKRPPNRFTPPAALNQDFSANIMSKLDNENSNYYLQSWNKQGQTLRKSSSLGDYQLPAPSSLQQTVHSDDLEYNSQLSNGDAIRVYSFAVQGGPRKPAVNISVAINREEMNQQLSSYALQLIGGGLFFCILLSAMLVFAIRKALTPIQNLSEQVAKVEAGSLHNRLIATNVPSEISPLVDRLNQLLARLEQSFARERQFNNDLAHELRTPLAAMRTTSEVALKWPEQSSSEDFQYIAESSAQLQQTIDSLLSLARIENSSAETLLEQVNITRLIEECLSLQTTQMQQRNITISQLVSQDQYIVSDPRLLRVIFSNLISNAIAYAPVNSRVIIDSESQQSVIRISNHAPHLAQDDLTTMFDRLWRKDKARTDNQHVGLGLSIAHSAAQALSLELHARLSEQQLHMSLNYSK
ncbi:sensor histidine kinase [Shewanella waksmanii]|uniref:sensor histidine kinase n=1 Tax=Shewanella waksmanii TaxID=213783 RepID=UPI00048DED24|nr:histidine kinase dimerization/phospho-acceptor domain-containing protein [Shewanella waksmanii]